MSDFHGWSKGQVEIHVGPLPGRRRPVLYLVDADGSRITSLATFRDGRAATTAVKALDRLILGKSA